MKVVLFFAAMFASGPAAEAPRSFETQKACEAFLAKLPAVVAKWNATEDNKILSFAAACVPSKPAKQGIAG